MKFENNLAFAKQLDEQDSLKHFRDQFYIPISMEKNVFILPATLLVCNQKPHRIMY